ncbi:MAG: hypothetical protein ACI9VN_003639, partial [Patescibacteria group bacterium]
MQLEPNKRGSFSIIVFLLFFICQAYTQPQEALNPGPNLVPNSGFEELRRKLPSSDLDGSVAFRNSIDKWMSPTKGTPDLSRLINAGSDQVDSPRTGKAMVAILTHNPESKRSDTYREYLQVKLEQPLVKGKEYYVEFWTKRSIHAKMTSNNMGLALSPAPSMHQDWRPLTDIHPIVNAEEIINPDQPEWIKISHTFKAANRERFLLIGNFYNNDNTTFGEVENSNVELFPNAYYLIDDVGLWQLNVLPEPEPVTLAEKAIEVGQIIRLDRIYFEFDKSNLLIASFQELDELLTLLHKYPTMKIAIHGHTDSRGSGSYNLSLSNSRSKSVYEYLL